MAWRPPAELSIDLQTRADAQDPFKNNKPSGKQILSFLTHNLYESTQHEYGTSW